MRYRVLGGLLGWVAAVLPLAAFNFASLTAIFNFQESVLAGGLAIAIGLLLGGVVAGLIGGRQRRGYQGGAIGGAGAGGFAALFYLLTLFALLAIASIAESEPLLVQDGLGAVWSLATLAFVALLIVAIATAAGALAGRRAPRVSGAGRAPSPSAAHGANMQRQPMPSRSAPGQPLRLPSGQSGPSGPSGPMSRPPAMPQRPYAPDAYPPAPRQPASAPRPRGSSGRTSRQP